MAGEKTEVDVLGLSETLAALESFPLNFAKNALRTSIYNAAKVTAELVSEAAPGNTGRLQDSIAARRGRGVTPDGFLDAGVAGVFYGMFIEYGTSKLSARPFARSTLSAHKEEILDAFSEGLDKAIERQAKKLAKLKLKE